MKRMDRIRKASIKWTVWLVALMWMLNVFLSCVLAENETSMSSASMSMEEAAWAMEEGSKDGEMQATGVMEIDSDIEQTRNESTTEVVSNTITVSSDTLFEDTASEKEPSEEEGNASAGADWKKAPTITSITQVGTKKIRVAWEPVSPAEKYRVYEYVGGKYRLKKTVKGETEAILTSVAKGTHTYVVRPMKTSDGQNELGSKSAKKKITVVDAWKVGPVITSLTQTGTGKVTLTWEPVGKADVYRIYEYRGGKYTLLKTVKSGTSANLKNLSAGNHRLVVQPLKKAGGVMKSGNYSEISKIKVVEGWKIPVTIRKVKQTGEGSVQITWKVNGEMASQYAIYEVNEGKYTRLSMVTGEKKATVTGLAPGTHTFVVRARQVTGRKTSYGQYSEGTACFVAILCEATEGDYTWTLTGKNQVTLKAYLGGKSILKMPETAVEGQYAVTGIGEGAFAGNTSLREVTLPEGITQVGAKAFQGSGLTTIHLPSTVTSIAEDAFDGTSLSNVTATKGSYAYSWGRALGLITEYRALVIGEKTFLRYNYNYSSGLSYFTDLAGRNVNSASSMATMLGQVTGPKGGTYTVTRKTDLTYEGIRTAIQSTFADAAEQDVSLFYIATHGNESGDGELEMPFTGDPDNLDQVYDYMQGGEDLLPFDVLASWLQEYVAGEVVVILEACGSGSAIYVSEAEQNSVGASGAAAAESFNPDNFLSQAVQAFERHDPGIIRTGTGGGFQANSTGDLRLPKFYVLASARHGELSWGYESDIERYNFFTRWLIQGIGSGSSSPADTSGDGILTLKELFSYVKKFDTYAIRGVGGPYYQHVQCYPVGSQYEIFRVY